MSIANILFYRFIILYIYIYIMFNTIILIYFLFFPYYVIVNRGWNWCWHCFPPGPLLIIPTSVTLATGYNKCYI